QSEMDPGGQQGHQMPHHPQQQHPQRPGPNGGHHPMQMQGQMQGSMLNISAPASRAGPMPNQMGGGGPPQQHQQHHHGGGSQQQQHGGPPQQQHPHPQHRPGFNPSGGPSPHGGPAPHGGAPPPQAPPGNGGPQGAPDDERQQLVQKCARFIRTIIQLKANENDPNRLESHARVKELVANVIFGSMEAEEFTVRLQQALNSQAQPHLLPFLQKTLPYLRSALRTGEVVIEGIRPPGQMQSHPSHPADDYPHSMPSSSSSSSMHPPQQAFVSAPAPEPAQLMPEDETRTRIYQETPTKTAMIKPEDIMRKITRRITNQLLMDEDVLALISDAAEYRLRKVMSELTALTEHRLYMLKSHPNYEAVDDTRRQIRFLEEIDREYEERRDAREKEMLIRASKNKKTGKETIERVKELQKADAEVIKNRDANAAAIAALSGGRGPKRKWEATNTAQSSARPRTLRVNMRDMQSVLSRDTRSKVALRIAYALSTSEPQI
ncbi:hypothetical protein PMAYCL1PPCAC_21953, partial [Pristionchus mayeri]